MTTSLYRIPLLFCAFCISIQNFAQQVPMFSQYMLNQYLLNPAVAGTSDDYHLNAGFRQQWVGVQDAPQTFYASGHGHIGKEHARLQRRHKNQNTWHHGMGFMVMGDRTGPISQVTASVSYAYDLSLNRSTRLSFGASAGVYNRTLNANRLRFYEESASTDQAVFNNAIQQDWKPDMDVGIWMYHKLFYAGIAANQLFMNKLKSPYDNITNGVDRLTQHYYVTGGGIFHPSREIAIIPSFMFRMVQDAWIKPSIDLNCKVKYDNMVWGGLSYRNRDAFVVMVGVFLDKKYEIGYAYDYTLSSLRSRSMGSHEIMIGYRLTPGARIISPSDFW